MQPAWSRILRVLFVAYVAATLVHIGWVMAHEPFAFDAWNLAQDTKAQPFSTSNFFDYWWYEYTHSNPRVGQALTYLAYKLEYFAVIATPTAYLALAVAVFALGAGRLPSWRRGRDLALVAITMGFAWFALPQIGKTLFNRAYGANYLYGAAIQLWFLVPLRLAPDGQARMGWAVAYGFAGVIAGMCNEHTGPTLALFMVVYAWWTHGKTQKRPLLAWAGALGVIAGFALIFFAPGQGERYDGLVQRVGLVGKLLQRGLTGNLEILRGLVLAAGPVLGLLVVLFLFATDDAATERYRRALRLIGTAMIAGVLITATIFVSPKLGPRFYLVPIALLLAGFIALADIVLITPRRLAPFVALAVVASTYAGSKSIGLYTRLEAQSDARLAALAKSQPGSVVTVDAFEQVEDSWWFLGDDFRDIRKRELVARYFALRDVVFRGYDPDAALAVTDVRLVARSVIEPETRGDDVTFELGWYRGIDVATIHMAMRTAVALFEERVTAAGGTLARLDLTVQFVGERPPLPRKQLVVGRWTRSAGLEAYVTGIRRDGRDRTREVVVPKPLADAELYIYQVGGEAKQLDAKAPRYVPWKTGVYWVLACREDVCFVTAAMRQAR
jgi:hypothetical protein